MIARNDITNDELKSKLGSKSYEEGWERIFGGNNKGKQPVATDDALRVLERPTEVQGDRNGSDAQ